MRTVLLTLSMVVGMLVVPASLANRSAWSGVVVAAPAAQAVQAADSQQAQPPQITVEVNNGVCDFRGHLFRCGWQSA